MEVLRRAGRQRYESPGQILVEGDASSASYFLAAGAIGGGPVRVEGVGRASIQGDVRFADVLEQMGARVTMGADWIESLLGGRLATPSTLDFNHIPDAAMTAAVLAPVRARARRALRNIGSWRVKETDRIAAMATELRSSARVAVAGADWISVTPPEAPLKPASPSIPTTITAWRCASRSPRSAASGAHQRSGLRGEDLPGLFQRAFEAIVAMSRR